MEERIKFDTLPQYNSWTHLYDRYVVQSQRHLVADRPHMIFLLGVVYVLTVLATLDLKITTKFIFSINKNYCIILLLYQFSIVSFHCQFEPKMFQIPLLISCYVPYTSPIVQLHQCC